MKLYKTQQGFQKGSYLTEIALLFCLLIFPAFAQSNNESQSVFQPSSVLDSPKRSGGTIAETIAKESEFKTLASALALAGLNETLEQGQKGEFTILAPTNQAFQKNGLAYARLLQPQNRNKLIRFLKYHVIKGEVQPEDVNRGEIQTVEGSMVKIKVSDRGVIMNDRARGIQPSIETSNGVIVRLDNLLIPPDLEP